MKKLTTLILVLALSTALLIGCAAPAPTVAREEHIHPEEIMQAQIQPELLTGGVLRLKINPEIAVHYDENGKVTKLEGHNAEGVQLVKMFTGYEGKDTAVVLEELVQVIGQAGYFVEEADGSARRIVLELDPGSQVPHEKFLEDMATHVKACVESKTWVGEREYDYAEPVPQETTAAAETKPAQTAPAVNPSAAVTVPAGLCPVCADDDCNDGKYCDDADDKAENLREYYRLMSGDVCPVCADPDCDDGKYCDDADEKAENQRENELKKNGLSKNATTKKATTKTRCPVCGDDDCDDGKYCDDWDDCHDD